MALGPNPVAIGSERRHKLQCELPEGEPPWVVGDVFTAAGGLLDQGVVTLTNVKRRMNSTIAEGTLNIGSAVASPNTLQVKITCTGSTHTLVVNLLG